MRLRYALVLVFCLIYSLTLAQSDTGTLKGRVIDSRTLEPLPYAGVFFNNTTLGTYTNAKGEFTLSNIPFGQYDFVVSTMGYQTYQVKIKINDVKSSFLVIKLIENILKAVEVKSTRDFKWEKQFDRFKKLFFGNSPYTANCKIYNPWVLDFQEDREGNFTATATAPLKVENLGLGYKIDYQLKEFFVTRNSFNIKGNVRFEELLTLDSATIVKWHKQRAVAYEGSYRHLFKSIADNKMEQEGFRIYEDKTDDRDLVRINNFLSNYNKSIFPYIIEDKVIHMEASDQYNIQMPVRLEVHYINKSASPVIYTNVTKPVSWIEVKDGFILIDDRGIVLNPAQMVVLGAMSDARVAEILPDNYQPPMRDKSKQAIIAKRKISPLAFLVEKPYLHTDRSYYYPHDMIWFEGYMNFFSTAMKDSLSHVLYVDLVNEAKQVLATRTFPVNDGRVAGNFSLPRGINKGDYSLRAYTRWMLNFDASFIYTKPVKVLDYLELARPNNSYLIDTSANAVKITSSKEQFEPREKITLQVDVKDFYGYSRFAHLSISVTDLQSAVPPENEKKITTDFSILSSALPDSLTPKPHHLIQYGVELKGYLRSAQDKKIKGLIKVAQDNTTDVFDIATNEEGDFYVPNLAIYDTAKLYVQAKSIKGKKPVVVILDSTYFVPSVGNQEVLKLDVYKSEAAIKDKRTEMPTQLPAHLLQDVTVTSTRIKEKARPRESIIDADFVIDEERLRKADSNDDLLTILQRSVSGLRVMYFNGPNGPTKRIMLGGPSSLMGSAEPLVLINGVALITDDDTAGDQLSRMPSSSVQRVEVVKFGMGAAYGSRGGNGVIHIFMRTDFGSDSKIPALDKTKFKRINPITYSSSLSFQSPDYSKVSEADKKGDYRITLYWNPDLITDGKQPTEVTFFAADLSTRYRIVVEGVDVDGKPVRGEKIITVK